MYPNSPYHFEPLTRACAVAIGVLVRVPGEPGGRSWPTVSVVVPALNESRNLPYVFGRIPPVHEVILVDGGSLDDTVTVARRLRPDVRVVRQNRTGKGNALACGFAAATGEIIVMLDADGSTDPVEVPRFVAALLAGADYAKGSRFAGDGGSADITAFRRAGNRALNALVNLLFRTRYSDLCYGYNAFWSACLPVFGLDSTTAPTAKTVRLWGDGFEIETLLNLRAARAGLLVAEVPSFEHARLFGLSNLNALRDGLRVLRTIGTEWRRPRPAPRRSRRQTGTELPVFASNDGEALAGTIPARPNVDMSPVASECVS